MAATVKVAVCPTWMDWEAGWVLMVMAGWTTVMVKVALALPVALVAVTW